MGFLEAIFLGLVQGLTEFLPVSSSGHLALVQKLFGMKDVPLMFDVLLHFGTLFAVFAAFWKDILAMLLEFGRMVSSLFGRSDSKKMPLARRLVMLIIVGTLPLVLTVFLSGIVKQAMQTPLAVGLLLCATGLLLYMANRLPRGEKNEKNALVSDALIVGVCQGIAVLPGLSRSGVTISAGLFRKFDRSFAVRFSFLLSVPAVLGATLLSLIGALRTPEVVENAPVYMDIAPGFYVVGMIVAALVGYIAIGLVRRLIGRGKFGGFAFYCLGLGLIAVIVSVIPS